MKYSCLSQSARTMNHRYENLGEHEKGRVEWARRGRAKMETGWVDGWTLPEVHRTATDFEAPQSKPREREQRQSCKASAWHAEILIFQFSGYDLHTIWAQQWVSFLPTETVSFYLCAWLHTDSTLSWIQTLKLGRIFCMRDNTNSQPHGCSSIWFVTFLFFFHRLMIYWAFHTCIPQRQWQTAGGSRNKMYHASSVVWRKMLCGRQGLAVIPGDQGEQQEREQTLATIKVCRLPVNALTCYLICYLELTGWPLIKCPLTEYFTLSSPKNCNFLHFKAVNVIRKQGEVTIFLTGFSI